MDEDERANALAEAGSKVAEAIRELYELLDGDEAALGEMLYECEKAGRRAANV